MAAALVIPLAENEVADRRRTEKIYLQMCAEESGIEGTRRLLLVRAREGKRWWWRRRSFARWW